MKRNVAFILVLAILLSSSVSFAAKGDFIHTGLKRAYDIKNATDRATLINDLKNQSVDRNLFYREVDDKKYVNVVEEEEAQNAKLLELLAANGISLANADAYFKDPKNIDKVIKMQEELSKATGGIKEFSAIETDGRDIQYYYGGSSTYAPRLKTPDNYSNPVPGSDLGTTVIKDLKLPSNAIKWVYKISDTAFDPIKPDTLITEGTVYTKGINIKINKDQYLLLCATDLSNKVKAYASMKITSDMVKMPRVSANKVEAITVTLDKGTKYSGSTIASGDLDEGIWKLAVLDTMPNNIYVDSEFEKPFDYVDGMEFVVANDSELDNMTVDSKKYIIIYSEKDGKIEKYNIFAVGKDKISPPMEAVKLNIDLALVVKGNATDTTKVINLDLTVIDGATKWMYVVGESLAVPLLGRVYPGALNYTLGDDIEAKVGQELMLLATDGSGKVKAYDLIALTQNMLKDPLAMKLLPETHYRNVSKGSSVGDTNITVSSSTLLDNLFDDKPTTIVWRYMISKDNFDIPELNSFIAKTNKLTSGFDFNVVSEKDLFIEEPFARNLLLLATEGTDDAFKVKGYAVVPLTREHVRYPSAFELVEGDNYSKPEKGPNPGTTKISTLRDSSIDGHVAWWYRVAKGEALASIEYKHLISTAGGFRSYIAGSFITASSGDYIVLVSVDKDRKVLAYKNILLGEDDITTDMATQLKPISHYEGPMPGSVANSTKFTKFYTDASTTVKWMFKKGSKSFGAIESGSLARTDEGFTEYTVGINITDVKPNDFILLVRTDSEYKVNGYVNIQLTQAYVRNDDAQVMNVDNYKIGMGDNPGNTKLYDLNRGGIDGSPHSGWKWMYKLLDAPLAGESLPYFNQKLDGVNLPVNGNIAVGNGPHYGYILLLATDGGGLTKAYVQIPVQDTDVRESAPLLDVSIGKGDSIDRIKFNGTETSYMYKTDTKLIPSPATNDILYGANKYVVTGNVGISEKVGTHLMIYKVDGDNKILAYKAFVIEDKDIQKGKVEIETIVLLEGSIKNGGQLICFTLQGNDEWNDVKLDANIRNKLYAGLKADKQNTEWLKVVSTLQAGGSGNIFVVGKKVSIRLPATEGYNISEDQQITLIVPFEAVKDAINPIVASNSITIKPTIDVSVSGTVVSDVVREKDIKNGGATIVLTLTDAFWNVDVKEVLENSSVEGATDQGSTNWGKIKAAVQNNPSSVVVTSEKVVTITLPKVDGVSYGSDKEIISLTINSNFIQGADTDVMATPKLTIYPDVLKVEMDLDDKDNKVIMQAPDNKLPLASNDTWKIKLINSTFKDNITDKDVSIIGMPAGLKPVIARLSDKELAVKMTGVASSGLVDGNVRLVVKGSAVKELNSVDSSELSLPYIKGTPMNLESIDYEIKLDGIYISMLDGFEFNKIRYSLDSTNGINGEWNSVTSVNHRVNELVGPLTIYVREEAQPKVFRKVINLNHPPAPVVAVKEYAYISKDGKNMVNITLESEVVDLEYSKNNGLEWSGLADKKITELDGSSVLIVRKKGLIGKTGVLPSLPTTKLNGLFLGDMVLNVGDSTINGATTATQYSLNSDENGNGGSWNAVKAPNPVISFANGNIVWIREGNSEINKRKLGTVSQVDPLTAGFNSVDYNILNKTLINKSDFDLQYRIANGTWFNLDKKSSDANFILNNVVFSPGVIEVRRRGAFDKLPSSAIVLAEIPLSVNPPELKFDNDGKTIKYLDGGVFKELDDLFEYKLGINGDWKNGSSLSTDDSRLSDITVFIRKKPTEKTVASKEVSSNFTKNISFTNVTANVAGGLIDGTTINMEYSTDSSNGTDGSWIVASGGKTIIKFVPGMNLYIREKGKPSTFKDLIKDLKRETVPVLDGVSYDVLTDKIANGTDQNLEYRIAEGAWTKIDANSNKVPAGLKAGKLEFRKPATASTLESSTITKDIIMSEGSAPVVDYNDTKNIINSINSSKASSDWGIFEYKVDSTSANAWSNGIHLSTQDLSGDKNVEIRIKATPTTLASKIAMVKFTKNLELSLVTLSDYTKPYELNGTTTDMEYKIIYLDGKELGWNKCLKDNTPLVDVMDTNAIAQIILRDGRLGHRDNERIIINNADSAPMGVRIDSYDYTSPGKVIVKVVGVDNTMEYRVANDSDWVAITSDVVNVELDGNSDLRVRVKASSGKLASIYTPILNGLYLGDLTLKDSKLISTNLSMEYSIDDGAKWILSKESETAIEMKAGNVIKIRQLGSDINIRTIGTVVSAAKPDAATIDYSIKNRKIVATTNLEYRIAEGPWIIITENPVTDVNFAAGKLEFRTRSSGLNLSSEPITKATIQSPVDTPDLRPIDTGKKIIEYYDIVDGAWKVIDGDFEYKIGSNGSWKPTSDFASDPLKDGKVIVSVRKVATHNTLPSNDKSISFEASILFTNVKSNIALGVIENTTTSMEYSINSTNGLDGAWDTASNGKTSIEFVEGMSIWIREKGKPDNFAKLLNNLIRENAPSDSDMDFDIAMGTISNKSSSNLEFRIKKGDWKKLAANTTINIDFGDGSLEFRKAATVDMLESLNIEKFVIMAAASSPVVISDDVNNKITSINGLTDSNILKNYQYRIVGGAGNWIQGELLLTDIDLSGNKTIEVRKKATANTLASQIAKIVFTKNLELNHVTLSTHVKPLELNGTTVDMEYMVWLSDGTESQWTKCTKDNTKLNEDWTLEPVANYISKIVIRDSRENQQENIFIVYPK